jgi:cell division protein FtsL
MRHWNLDMAKTAPGTLVVAAYNPAAARKKMLLVISAWLISLAAVYFYCKATMTPGFARTQSELSAARSEIVRQQNDVEALRGDVAKYQRGEQVAKEANAALQGSIDQRQQEIASLRADLSFFKRFAGGGNAEALGVQDVSVEPTDDARVFKYAISVSQNLKRGTMVSGNLRFSVSGISASKPKTLEMATLLGEGGAKVLKYQFKYFQVLSGTLYLPEGFAPGAIKASMVNEDGESASKEVTWDAAQKAGREVSG